MEALHTAVWLITGGAGALGLLTAAWLAAEGSSSATAATASAASTAAADEDASQGRAVELGAAGGKGARRSKRLVLTSRNGRLAPDQQPELVRQLLTGAGAFATSCVIIARYPSANGASTTDTCGFSFSMLVRW